MGDFTVDCPQCRENLMVSTDFIGQDVSCPACNFVFKVNAPGAPVPPQPQMPVPPMPPQPQMAPGAPIPPPAQPQMAPGAPIPPPVQPQMAPGAPVPPQMAPGAMPGASVPPKAKTPFNFMLFKLIASGANILLAFIMFAVATFVPMFWDKPDYAAFYYLGTTDGSSQYSSSVSVGESSYATAKNTRKIVANTERIANGNKYIYEIEEFREIFFNWGFFFLILAVVFAVFPKPETKKKDN